MTKKVKILSCHEAFTKEKKIDSKVLFEYRMGCPVNSGL